MKKPVSRIAIIFWVLAVVLPVLNVSSASLVNGLRQHAFSDPAFHQTNAYFAFSTVLGQVRAALVDCALLAGMGFLIEWVDQIRWDVRSKDKP